MNDCCKTSKDVISKPKTVSGRICYCFEYDEQDFLRAVETCSEMELVEEIKQKMKDPGCFCEVSNPSGKCCLSDIKKILDSID